MNHTYKLIWSDTRQTWVAVPEYASAKGKRASGSVLLLAVGSAVAQTPPVEMLAKPVTAVSEATALGYEDNKADQLVFSADRAVDIDVYSENTPLDPSLDSPLAEQSNLVVDPVLDANSLAVQTLNQDQNAEDLVLLSQNSSARADIPIIEFPTLTENLDYVPTELQVETEFDGSQIANAETSSFSSNKVAEASVLNATDLDADLVVTSINLPAQPALTKDLKDQTKPLEANSAPTSAMPDLAIAPPQAEKTVVESSVVAMEKNPEIVFIPQVEEPVNSEVQVQTTGNSEALGEKLASDLDFVDSVMQVAELPQLLVNQASLALAELDWLSTAEISSDQVKVVEQTPVEPKPVAMEPNPAVAVASGVESVVNLENSVQTVGNAVTAEKSPEDVDFINAVKQFVVWPALVVDQAGSAIASLDLLPDLQTENIEFIASQPVQVKSDQPASQAIPADSKHEPAAVSVVEPDTDIDSYLRGREAEKRHAMLEQAAQLKLNSLNQASPLYSHALLEDVLAESEVSDEDKALDLALKNTGDQPQSSSSKTIQQPEFSLKNQLLSSLFNDDQVGNNIDQDDLSIDSLHQAQPLPKAAELISNGLGQQAAAFTDLAITSPANSSCNNSTQAACQVNVAVKQLPAANSLGLIEVTIPKMAKMAKQGLNIDLPDSVWQETNGGVLTATTETGAKLPSWMRLETREGQAQIDLAKFPVRALPMTLLLNNGKQNWQLKIMPELHTSKANG